MEMNTKINVYQELKQFDASILAHAIASSEFDVKLLGSPNILFMDWEETLDSLIDIEATISPASYRKKLAKEMEAYGLQLPYPIY